MDTKREQIVAFLETLPTQIDVLTLVDIDDIDENNAFESIVQMIDDEDGFGVPFACYEDAMDYLSENDPSLMDSLAIVHRKGFEVNDLDSELLANFLAKEKAKSEFFKLKEQIDDFFAGLIG